MKWIKIILIIAILFLMLAPLIFVVLGSTNNTGWAFLNPIEFSFGNQFRSNVSSILRLFNIVEITLNSILISFVTATLSIVMLFFAAYAFEKYSFKYKQVLYAVVISSIFIPSSAILIGQLKTIYLLGMYGTMTGLILPFLINIRVFQYLKNASYYVPIDIIEAARIDGSNEWSIITNISIPLIKDKLLIAFFMLFVSSWNNFLIPVIMTSTKHRFTIPIMISSLSDPLRYEVGATFLALLISILPIVLLFIILQNGIIKIYDD
jgi:multiple sugar transport system permease protein